MAEIGFPYTGACQLLCDNKVAISMSEHPVQHYRTKHVEVDRHFIKEKLEDELIELPFVKSEDQLANILTKAVNDKIFNITSCKLGIGDTTPQLEGECWRSPESGRSRLPESKRSYSAKSNWNQNRNFSIYSVNNVV